MNTSVQQAVHPEVRVSVGAGTDNVVVLEGLMREIDPAAWFIPLINKVHAKLVAGRIANVIVDIRRLSYANAAGWKCFVYWLKKMQDDCDAYYRMCFLCEESHGWQSVGMAALFAFGGDRLVVKIYRGERHVG